MLVSELTCDQCGKGFIRQTKLVKGASNNFCGRACYYAFQKGKIKESGDFQILPLNQVCAVCGRTFRAVPSEIKRGFSKCCSQECTAIYRRRNKLVLTCEQCGNTFMVSPSYAEKGKKFCSLDCAHRSQITAVKAACQQCGKNFTVGQSRIKNGGGKFCSIECAGVHKRTSIEQICNTCGKSFSVQPHRIKNGRGVNCSMQCYRRAQQSKLEDRFATLLDRAGVLYVRQFKVAYYHCDFFLPAMNLIIEVDGEYWHSSVGQQAKDARKNRYLQNRGYDVVRLGESEVNSAVRLTDLVSVII